MYRTYDALFINPLNMRFISVYVVWVFGTKGGLN